GSLGFAAMIPAAPHLDRRLFTRKQDFVQPPAGRSDVDDLDVETRLQAGQADHAFGKLGDLDQLAHVGPADRKTLSVGRSGESALRTSTPTKRASSLPGSTTATIVTPASTAQRVAISARSDFPAST